MIQCRLHKTKKHTVTVCFPLCIVSVCVCEGAGHTGMCVCKMLVKCPRACVRESARAYMRQQIPNSQSPTHNPKSRPLSAVQRASGSRVGGREEINVIRGEACLVRELILGHDDAKAKCALKNVVGPILYGSVQGKDTVPEGLSGVTVCQRCCTRAPATLLSFFMSFVLNKLSSSSSTSSSPPPPCRVKCSFEHSHHHH